MKAINIPIEKRKYLRTYVEFLNPILNLVRNEYRVLGELVYWYKYYSHLEPGIRDKLVFDYDTKVKIMEELGISHQELLNCITKLRKKGWIVNQYTVSDKLISLIDENSKMLVVKFTLLEQ